MIAAVQNFRLCVDGRMLGPGGTGVSTYARALAAAHRRLSSRHHILVDNSDQPGSAGMHGKVRRWLRAAAPLGVRARARGLLFHAPDLFRLAQVYFDVHGRLLTIFPPVGGGVMHWSYPVPLRMAGWHNIYTIHDAIPLTDPTLTSIDPKRHRWLLRTIAATADGLITVSATARQTIATALALPADRITNCSQPVIPPPIIHSSPPAGLIPGAYLLAVGTVEQRKNITRLLQGYSASGVAIPLVIAGPAAKGASDLEDAARSTAGVIRMPYLEADGIMALIAGALALVMPSLAEGFGLPVAEAMSLGTPVITSHEGALAETAGGAALLVDPTDVHAIATAIATVTAHDDLRSRLRAAGYRNAERFTPEGFARRLTLTYGRLVAQPPRSG